MRDRLIAWRRDFHRYPELAYQEQRTADIVARHLRRLGYQVTTGVAKTGVIGLLSGDQSGPVVMFRFDMDALALAEENDVPYASQVPGCMHACGHDGHVALGMGLAELLAARRDEMRGTVKLIFQPAEEEGSGAMKMIEAGVLGDPRPDLFIASHLWINSPAGTVDVRPGPVMAGSDRLVCTIHGRAGHGALPHQTVDPIVAAVQVVSALQTVVSRNVDPLDAAVVSIGSIHGGEASNAIPPQVKLTGSIRAYDPNTRKLVLRRVREVIKGVATACGATAELTFTPLGPAIVNDPKVAGTIRRAAEAVLGPERVTAEQRTTASEDAAFFMQHLPGCYFFIGAGNAAQGFDAPHHHPRFDFDEEALTVGLAVLAQSAASYLFEASAKGEMNCERH